MKKYDKEIPKEEKEIYEIYEEILKMEILFTKKFDVFVNRMYQRFNAIFNEPILAGKLTKDALRIFRSESTIRKSLPDESKDPGRQKGAQVSNEKQKSTKRIVDKAALETKSKADTRKPVLTEISTTQTPAKKEVKEIWVKYPQTGIVARTISKLQEQKEEDIRVKVDLVDLVIIDALSAKELEESAEPIATPTRPH